MIIACPNCGTKYRLPDDALLPDGRNLRCKSCEHRWFEAPRMAEPEPEPPVPAPAEPRPAPPPAPPPLPEPTPDPQPAAIETMPVDAVEARVPRRRWPWVLLAVVLLLAGGAGGLSWAVGSGRLDPATVPGLEALAGRQLVIGIPEAPPSALELRYSAETRELPGGGNILEVTGRIDNPTKAVQPVPPIEASLVDGEGETIYSWTIPPPARRLAPAKGVNFDSSAVNTPPHATGVRLVLRPSRLPN